MTCRARRHLSDREVALYHPRFNRRLKDRQPHQRLTGRHRKEGEVDSSPSSLLTPSGRRTLNLPSLSGASLQRRGGGSGHLPDAMTTTTPVATSLHAGLRRTHPQGDVLRRADERTVSRLDGWSA